MTDGIFKPKGSSSRWLRFYFLEIFTVVTRVRNLSLGHFQREDLPDSGLAIYLQKLPKSLLLVRPHSTALTTKVIKMNIMPSFFDRKHRQTPRRESLLPQKHGYRVLEAPEAGFDGASISGAVFNLSTTVVGAGIMALPATINQLGLIPGLLAIIFVSMLTGSSIDKILRFSRASKSATYSGVAADAFGGTGRNILQVCIVINNLGMLVVYMIIIGKFEHLPPPPKELRFVERLIALRSPLNLN